MAYDNDRTTRIGYLCVTIVTLGLIAFLTKDCDIILQSCNAPTPCHDEFIPFDATNQKTCYPGARGEVVTTTTPPGILCHCINSSNKAGEQAVDAGSSK